LHSNLKQATDECVYFQSLDKDGSHTIQSSSSSRNEYYLGGIITLYQFVAASTWWQISTEWRARK